MVGGGGSCCFAGAESPTKKSRIVNPSLWCGTGFRNHLPSLWPDVTSISLSWFVQMSWLKPEPRLCGNATRLTDSLAASPNLIDLSSRKPLKGPQIPKTLILK